MIHFIKDCILNYKMARLLKIIKVKIRQVKTSQTFVSLTKPLIAQGDHL